MSGHKLRNLSLGSVARPEMEDLQPTSRATPPFKVSSLNDQRKCAGEESCCQVQESDNLYFKKAKMNSSVSSHSGLGCTTDRDLESDPQFRRVADSFVQRIWVPHTPVLRGRA